MITLYYIEVGKNMKKDQFQGQVCLHFSIQHLKVI